MIAQNIQIRLNGTIFTAFQIFCAKRGCELSSEGIRAMIRELPEYQELAGNNSTSANPESQAESQAENEKLSTVAKESENAVKSQ